jgi:PAS domain S-box-containing protein
MPLAKGALERLIEASPDIVVATDTHGNVAYYNDGAAETLGYARDEIIGQHVARLYPGAEEAKRVKAAMRDPATFEKGRVLSFPTRFVAKDGHEIPVAISGVILYSGDGVEEGTIGFAKDLSEIIRKDQLAVLGEIAVGLSHEINNPLEVILNQLALLERFVDAHAGGEPVADEQGCIASTRTEIGRITQLLERLGRMAEGERYQSTEYIHDARMIDLSQKEPETRLSGAHLLVVDDDEGVRRSISSILEADGCRVEQASNGIEALERLRESSYDLVLSDVVMPDMDGYELFQAVRKNYPGLPVALMTAFYYDREHVLKRSRLEGLDGVLFKKPIDPARLRETLGALIRPPQPAPSSH